MSTGAEISSLISNHGIAILAPLAVIEGPIVTVIAAYLARQGLLVLWQVTLCIIIADLVGDLLYYAVGRGALGWMPIRWRERLGITDARLSSMATLFEEQGPRVLIVGKLTHAAGFAVLVGAGAARMRIGPFLLANLIAGVPKALFLIAVGYLFGSAHDAIGHWISVVSAVLLVAMGGGLVYWLRRRKVS